jgi:hypothetical protein
MGLKCGNYVHVSRFLDRLEKCEAFGPFVVHEPFLGLQSKIQDKRQAEFEYILSIPHWGRKLVGRVEPRYSEFQDPP